MKPIKITLLTALMAILNTSLAVAQEVAGGSSSVSSTTRTTTTSTNSDWVNSPWVWIIAGAVFILILAAVLTSGRRSRVVDADSTTTQRTTITRTDELTAD